MGGLVTAAEEELDPGASTPVQSDHRPLPSRHQLGPPRSGSAAWPHSCAPSPPRIPEGSCHPKESSLVSLAPNHTPRPIHSKIAQPAGEQASRAWGEQGCSSVGSWPTSAPGQGFQLSGQGCPQKGWVGLAGCLKDLTGSSSQVGGTCSSKGKDTLLWAGAPWGLLLPYHLGWGGVVLLSEHRIQEAGFYRRGNSHFRMEPSLPLQGPGITESGSTTLEWGRRWSEPVCCSLAPWW